MTGSPEEQQHDHDHLWHEPCHPDCSAFEVAGEQVERERALKHFHPIRQESREIDAYGFCSECHRVATAWGDILKAKRTALEQAAQEWIELHDRKQAEVHKHYLRAEQAEQRVRDAEQVIKELQDAREGWRDAAIAAVQAVEARLAEVERALEKLNSMASGSPGGTKEWWLSAQQVREIARAALSNSKRDEA